VEKSKKLEMITALATALSNCALYSADHPLVHAMAEKAVKCLDEIMGEDNELGIMAIQNELVFNREPFREKAAHVESFIRRLKRKGIEKIIFTKGVTSGEIVRLIEDISAAAEGVSHCPHITTGLVEVSMGGALEGISADELQALKGKHVEGVKNIFGGVSRFKRLDVAGLEDIVINFISVIRKEAGILNVMTPVRTYSDFTYTHATNVAILSIFQAESLGISGEYLHDIGIAALLHDVGKMFVSSEILEKPGKLNKEEWEEMQKHTLYGARYLLTLDDIPKIAIPVALEHHKGYNGEGYPETRYVWNSQHLCSQIVAISDFYDALRSSRPYKRGMGMEETLYILKRSAGTQYNPFLVDNFIKHLPGGHQALTQNDRSDAG